MPTKNDLDFAKNLVAKQIISKTEVQHYLAEVDRLQKTKNAISLENFLLKNGVISQVEVDRMKVPQKRVAHCDQCKAMYHIDEKDIGKTFKCKKCGATINFLSDASINAENFDQECKQEKNIFEQKNESMLHNEAQDTKKSINTMKKKAEIHFDSSNFIGSSTEPQQDSFAQNNLMQQDDLLGSESLATWDNTSDLDSSESLATWDNTSDLDSSESLATWDNTSNVDTYESSNHILFSSSKYDLEKNSIKPSEVSRSYSLEDDFSLQEMMPINTNVKKTHSSLEADYQDLKQKGGSSSSDDMVTAPLNEDEDNLAPLSDNPLDELEDFNRFGRVPVSSINESTLVLDMEDGGEETIASMDNIQQFINMPTSVPTQKNISSTPTPRLSPEQIAQQQFMQQTQNRKHEDVAPQPVESTLMLDLDDDDDEDNNSSFAPAPMPAPTTMQRQSPEQIAQQQFMQSMQNRKHEDVAPQPVESTLMLDLGDDDDDEEDNNSFIPAPAPMPAPTTMQRQSPEQIAQQQFMQQTQNRKHEDVAPQPVESTLMLDLDDDDDDDNNSFIAAPAPMPAPTTMQRQSPEQIAQQQFMQQTQNRKHEDVAPQPVESTLMLDLDDDDDDDEDNNSFIVAPAPMPAPTTMQRQSPEQIAQQQFMQSMQNRKHEDVAPQPVESTLMLDLDDDDDEEDNNSSFAPAPMPAPTTMQRQSPEQIAQQQFMQQTQNRKHEDVAPQPIESTLMLDLDDDDDEDHNSSFIPAPPPMPTQAPQQVAQQQFMQQTQNRKHEDIAPQPVESTLMLDLDDDDDDDEQANVSYVESAQTDPTPTQIAKEVLYSQSEKNLQENYEKDIYIESDDSDLSNNVKQNNVPLKKNAQKDFELNDEQFNESSQIESGGDEDMILEVEDEAPKEIEPIQESILPRNALAIKFEDLSSLVNGTAVAKNRFSTLWSSTWKGHEVLAKIFEAPFREDQSLLEDFQNAYEVKSDNMITFHTIGNYQGKFCCLTEPIANLREIKQVWPMIKTKPALLQKICITILQSLAFVHEHRIIHGNFTLDSLYIQGEKLLISDFGLNRIYNRIHLIHKSKGKFVPVYSSPEHLQYLTTLEKNPNYSKMPLSYATDIYSLGVIFYWMLTSKFPYRHSLPYPELIQQIMNITPIEPKAINQGVSVGLNDLVMRCLNKQAKDRFGTVREILKGFGL